MYTYLRQGLYKAVYVGSLGCFNDLLIGHLSEESTIADILSNGGIKQHWLLGHYTYLLPQPTNVHITNIIPIHSETTWKQQGTIIMKFLVDSERQH